MIRIAEKNCTDPVLYGSAAGDILRGRSNIAASKCRISLKPYGHCVLEYSLPFLGKFRLSMVPELFATFSRRKGLL